MKKFVFATITIFVVCSANGQYVEDYLKAADNYFNKGDYFSAATYYEKAIDTSKAANRRSFNPYAHQAASKQSAEVVVSREDVVYKLAESYRLLNYPAKAEPHYEKSIPFRSKFPLAEYHYATVLRALGKYTESELYFTSFISSYPVNDDNKKMAEREIQNIRFIRSQMNRTDLKYFTVNKAPAELNAGGANYAPTWLSNSSFLFTSTRPNATEAKNKVYTNRIYTGDFDGTALSNIRNAGLPDLKDFHQGVTASTPDGNRIFFTRWTTGKQKTAAIYTSTRNGQGWSEPIMLDSYINADGSNTQQPSVTPDGKYLLFASDKSGGHGGFDLYYAPLDAQGTVGSPINFGSVINTEFDEQAPSYHAASSSLVFSTNGRVGMGGYDFFHSKGTIGNLTAPVNFGHPVNSIKDDIYFASRGRANNILEDVMLSSDRDAACCLEMFYLKKVRPLRQITGKVISCDPSKPLSSATVRVLDTINGKTVFTQSVNADGSYSFTLEDYLPLKVEANASGFFTKAQHVTVPADMEIETVTYPVLCLVPEPPKVNETFVVENVYYDFNEAELKVESFPALDEIVRMMNTYPNMVIELSAHTDSKGSNDYNLRLSEARARSVVRYLVSKGLDETRLRARGYGETKPIAPNTNPDGSDNPEGREKNRRTEFKVLQN